MIVQKTKKTDLDHILIHRETVLPNRAIMLFHGLTGSPYELKKYAKFLFDKGFDVYCYCLPGHGSHEIDIYSVKERDWRNFAQERGFAGGSSRNPAWNGGFSGDLEQRLVEEALQDNILYGAEGRPVRDSSQRGMEGSTLQDVSLHGMEERLVQEALRDGKEMAPRRERRGRRP